MDRELDVLDKVKKEHRRRQANIHPFIGYEEHESKFKRHVRWYLVALAILALAEIIALALSTAGLRPIAIQSSYLMTC